MFLLVKIYRINFKNTNILIKIGIYMLFQKHYRFSSIQHTSL